MECGKKKIDLGCGRLKEDGYIGIDIMPFTDNKGNQIVDIVRDVENEGLPFCDNSCEVIKADSVLEHIYYLEFVLNECWRVLKKGGVLKGIVPTAGSNGAWRDPTHRRFFVKSTFDYICGESEIMKDRPAHPKYARYNFKAWDKIKIEGNDGNIRFEITPRK